uniref:5-bromo-4-chloroindolyl phosphate hydrolysis protein n=1 Tax=viral metagenome TaxID=1070528 RepID=A0A6C0FH47_9ZZZZ|tara:strand:+ start:39693 stop:40844 length:1152 start_codon:yes stop_codon:yes gene_type:complete
MSEILELQPDSPGTEYPEAGMVERGTVKSVFKNILIPLVAAIAVTFVLFFPNLPVLGYFRKTLGHVALFLWGLIAFILVFSNTTTFKMSINQQKYLVYAVIASAFGYSLLFNIEEKKEIPIPKKEILLDVYSLYKETLADYISSGDHSLEQETLVYSELLTKMAVKLSKLGNYKEKDSVKEIIDEEGVNMFIKAFKVMKLVKKSLEYLDWEPPIETAINSELKTKIDGLKDTFLLIDNFYDSLGDGWDSAPIPEFATDSQQLLKSYYDCIKELKTIGETLVRETEFKDAEIVYTELLNKLKVLLCENKLDFAKIVEITKSKTTDVITEQQIIDLKTSAHCIKQEEVIKQEQFTQNIFSNIHEKETDSIQDKIDNENILYVRPS